MKKIPVLLICLLLLFGMCGCSLEFTDQAEEGNFTYAYGKKSAFVTEYRWDGTEEGLNVMIPERIHGLKVVSVGGYFGRGLPMPFCVDISNCFPDGTQWADSAVIDEADETIELVFTIIVPEQIDYDDVTIMEQERSEWLINDVGKTIEYRISIDVVYED